MRRKYVLEIKIPQGTKCSFENGVLKCERNGSNLERKISILGTEVKVDSEKITLVCDKANKKNIAMIGAFVAHIKNMLKGLEKEFEYKLEICNVHFPMTVKVEGDKVVVSNFLGEKINRHAKIISDVKVEVKGKEVSVTGKNIEKVGQTAANIERSAIVPDKDRRVFQDGIFITEKPGGKI